MIFSSSPKTWKPIMLTASTYWFDN